MTQTEMQISRWRQALQVRAADITKRFMKVGWVHFTLQSINVKQVFLFGAVRSLE
jgi:hypothetical protein